MPAHYKTDIDKFLDEPEDLILGCLTREAAHAGFYQQKHSQTDAWRIQIECLKQAFRVLNNTTDHQSTYHVLLEYPIPRRGKRVDAIIITGNIIFVVEFKCGATKFTADAVAQVEDYALDLRDFHLKSRGRILVPVLVAMAAYKSFIPSEDPNDMVKATWRSNAPDLGDILRKAIDRYRDRKDIPINPQEWDHSDYFPTPTIIESAQALYANQNVKEISRCHGGVENLTKTSEAVIQAIDWSRRNQQKLICFITGVPGAGKTLAGLNIVHNHDLHESDLGVFLSGNGPLVKVLQEALAQDHAKRNGSRLADARRRTSTFIQNVHKFIDGYFADHEKVPIDKVIIFDEAQRAWDADRSQQKFNRPYSEPQIMLEIMNRHPDWALIVALIGGGQEINSGEAGLAEWGRAIASHFPYWHVLISPELAEKGHYDGGSLFDTIPQGIDVQQNTALHLDVSLRSYRAETLSDFVSALLSGEIHRCQQLLKEMPDYPVLITRNLDQARSWLKEHQRGSRRIGLIASSGARRLKAYGLDVTADLAVEKWLLKPPGDVRSSYYLETPATEFAIQGLELDWTGVCWGGDLYPDHGQWIPRRFLGNRWVTVRNERTQDFIVNKYRVLLTRAREGMIIWVPEGDRQDHSRPPKIYDAIYNYLQTCGIPEYENTLSAYA